jgi:addiction module HigA family antidote
MTSRTATPSPGQLLRQELQQRGWKQKELAQRCGCSPGMIGRILSDRTPVSPNMDCKLSLVLGTPGGYWLHANIRWIAELRGWSNSAHPFKLRVTHD